MWPRTRPAMTGTVRSRSRSTSRRSRPTRFPGRRRRPPPPCCRSGRRRRRHWARWRREPSPPAPWSRSPRCSAAAARPPGPGSPSPPPSASRGWWDSSPTNPGRPRPTFAPTPRRARSGSGAAPQLDLVQGTVCVGGRVLPWLEMTAGPVVRAYVTDSTTERWVFWQARARVDAPIVVGQLGTYLEVWRALASQVNLPTGAGRIQGGEAGVVFQPAQQRVWLRLSYRLDDALLGGPGGNETMEAIA